MEVLDNTGKGHFKLGKYCFVNKQIILEYVCLLHMFRNMQPRTYFHENSTSEELIMTNNSNGIKFIKYRVYHWAFGGNFMSNDTLYYIPKCMGWSMRPFLRKKIKTQYIDPLRSATFNIFFHLLFTFKLTYQLLIL